MPAKAGATRSERGQKSEDVRRKITNAALRLFVARGYAETTIREISSASAVSSGSIYHFYGDKEGIFQQLALRIFQMGLGAADQRLKPDDSPYLHLALRWAGVIHMISGPPRVAEMFSLAYRSRKITDTLLPIVSAYHRRLLNQQLADWSDDQVRATTLLLQGALSALISERLHHDRLSEEQRIRSLLATFLPAFGADASTTRSVTEKALGTLAGKPDILKELLTQNAATRRTASAK